MRFFKKTKKSFLDYFSFSNKVIFRLKLLLALLVVFFVVFVLSLLLFASSLPSLNQITNREISESTKIYDRSGEIILFDINAGEKRTIVPLEEIPDHLEKATIAIEDSTFYNGAPFNIRSIVRAFFANLKSGEIVQGGSTITQQLAKNAFLSPEQTISRKVKELLLAIRLDRHYSKDEILELYLNEIPYGSTFYGAESASLAYFGKSVEEISVAESAILAAMPQAPTYYSPWGNHVDELIERSRFVLSKMKDFGYISKEQYNEALQELNKDFSFALQSDLGIKAPHFVFEVQDYLIDKYGEELVRTGGLQVVTTLDWDLQKIAEESVLKNANRNSELYGGKNAALVAENPDTGEILALVGSKDYFDKTIDGNFNVATQGLRQPGSTLKPFVYLSAFLKGYTPDTYVFDLPTEFSTDRTCSSFPPFTNLPFCFHPGNFDLTFRGPVSLERALAQSMNVPAAKVLYLAGMNNTIQNLQNFGLETLDDPSRFGLSLVLGGGEVRLIDLVKAYSVLAADGIKNEQNIILEIRDKNGQILEKMEKKEERVVDSQYPRIINDILSNIELRSGLFSSSLPLTIFRGHDVALKTGTTNDYRDAWAVGYTPSLVVGVWAGNSDNTPMKAQGSSLLAAVPMWHDFMDEALKKTSFKPFPNPDPIFASKPALVGNFLDSSYQPHSLLFFVDKNNPAGAPPSNPNSDPQFFRWEAGVSSWSNSNLAQYINSNPNLFPSNTLSSSSISIQTPTSGSFIDNPFRLVVDISSPKDIENIKIIFNNKTIQSFSENLGSFYRLDTSLSVDPSDLFQQNILRVEAIDSENNIYAEEIIVY